MTDFTTIPVTVCKFFCAIKWKIIFAGFLALLELLIGDIYSPLTVAIIILMIIDILSGLFASWSMRVSITSGKLLKGLVVKCLVYGSIIVSLLIVAHQLTHIPEQLAFLLLSTLTYSMIFLTEGSSILENLWKISVCYELENFWWSRAISLLLKSIMTRILRSYNCNDTIIMRELNKKCGKKIDEQ